MPNDKNFWTQKRDDGKWETKQEGADRASKVFENQTDSWDYTKERAKDSKGEAFLKNQKGKIRERNTYGDDPHPPKG